MKTKQIILAAALCFGFTASYAKSIEPYSLQISKNAEKMKREINIKLKTKEGCEFQVKGTVTLDWGTFVSFSGTITVTGPKPPCPNGTWECAFVSHSDRGSLTYTRGSQFIFNMILANNEDLANPIWDAMQF